MSGKVNVLERLGAGFNVRAAHLAPVLGLSRAAFYKAIERGEVEAVEIGRSKLIPAHEGLRLVGQKKAA